MMSFVFVLLLIDMIIIKERKDTGFGILVTMHFL